MKKAFIFIGICSIIAACASPEERAEQQNQPAQNQSATAQQSSADTNATKIGTDNTTTDAGTTASSGSTGSTASGTAGSAKGRALIEKSDCLTCHKDDVRIVGPSYKEVADKYPATDATYAMLAKKIIEGGSGNWGEIPMTPHPDLSESDAKEMAKYVMSLK